MRFFAPLRTFRITKTAFLCISTSCEIKNLQNCFLVGIIDAEFGRACFVGNNAEWVKKTKLK